MKTITNGKYRGYVLSKNINHMDNGHLDKGLHFTTVHSWAVNPVKLRHHFELSQFQYSVTPINIYLRSTMDPLNQFKNMFLIIRTIIR